MKFQRSKLIFPTIASAALLFASCGSDPEPVAPVGLQETDTFNDSESGAAGNVLKYKGQFFSIPSPIQAAILIKQTELDFNPEVINSLENSAGHISRFQKALNLGIYGADLGYLSNFNNTTMNLAYFGQVQSLAEELDIKNNIDPNLLMRFGENMQNADSLYSLNAELYKAINQYLKENEQNETASLILAGGWLEALWLSIDKSEDHEELRTRIGQQGSGLSGLVYLLEPYEDEQVKQFRQGLIELADTFGTVQTDYAFVEPITDANAKTTYLRSTSGVHISNETLAAIRAKVSDIRNAIIH